MKIEKLNENQIRCTLTREDLESRHINLSELAYGSEKAKSLFREMMRFASYKFGFEAEDIPLMIEAVPVSSDAIILIVTKVPFPDELDARFSEFTEEDYDDFDYDDYDEMSDEVPVPQQLGSANDILQLYDNASEIIDSEVAAAVESGMPAPSKGNPAPQLSRLFEFDNIDDIMNAASVIGTYYHGVNNLYRTDMGTFYLVVFLDDHTPEEFNRVCNTLTEYASLRPISLGRNEYIKEHCTTVILKDALSKLNI